MNNPCVFKRVCSECTKVSLENRPMMCQAIGCSDYVLCPECGLNKTLHPYMDKKICKKCIQAKPEVRNASNSIVKEKVREQLKEISQNNYTKNFAKQVSSGKSEEELQAEQVAKILGQATGATAKTSMQIPGIAPEGLPDDEKEYYTKRYQEYKEYYRNPSSFFLCHQIILVEMFINNINTRLIQARGEANFSLLQEQAQASKILSEYKKMLPDAESEQVSDHERAMGMIYESYCKEINARKVNGISRVLTSGAIALNPVLKFPMNLPATLKNMGFELKDVEEVEKEIAGYEELPKMTKEQVAEFFGFRITKQYAIDEEDSETDSIMDEELELYQDEDENGDNFK